MIYKKCLTCKKAYTHTTWKGYTDNHRMKKAKYCSRKCNLNTNLKKINQIVRKAKISKIISGNKEILLDTNQLNKVKKIYWLVGVGGYAIGTLNKKKIYLHRYILNNKKGIVDHIDRNKLNNTLKNLRLVSHSQNLLNNGKENVYQKQDKFVVQIARKYFGIYKSREEARQKAVEIKTRLLNNEKMEQIRQNVLKDLK